MKALTQRAKIINCYKKWYVSVNIHLIKVQAKVMQQLKYNPVQSVFFNAFRHQWHSSFFPLWNVYSPAAEVSLMAYPLTLCHVSSCPCSWMDQGSEKLMFHTVHYLQYLQVTPLTALKFAELSVKAGIPKGVINILPGSGNRGIKSFFFPNHLN